MATSPRSAAVRAGSHPVVEAGARLGYAASGLLHLLIAWLTVQLVVDVPGGQGAGERADQQGALRTLAGTGVGGILLWLTFAGFVLLALWQLTEAIARTGTGDRVKAAGKAVVYAALAWSALSVVRDGGSGGGGQGQGGSGGSGGSLSGDLLANQAGRLLVGAVGLGVAGVAVYHVVKGLRARFLRDLREHPGRWTVRAGRIGYVAKGVALGLVAWFLVGAAVGAEGDQPAGLDATLHKVAGWSAGPALLVLVAVGFAAYGLYSFARARYARV